MKPSIARDTSKVNLFVPAFPTVRPEELLGLSGKGVSAYHPFSAPAARYFYFARNAIFRAVKTLQLHKGEVLAPAYHHGVEIEALIAAGAGVRFYRIGPRLEVDMADVERKIRKETTALYLTHFLGFPGPVEEMKDLAHKHGLPLIEDCALALFSADGDRPLGITGDIAIFCLYKVLPVPDGGVLVRNGNQVVDRPWPKAEPLPAPPLPSTLAVLASSMLRNVALRGGGPGRVFRRTVLGFGRRALSASKVEPVLAGTQHFNESHAGLGLSPITKRLLRSQDVPAIVARRRENYEFLQEHLQDLSPLLVDVLPKGAVPLCFPLLVDDNRRVMEALVARGIEGVDFWREGHPSCDISGFPDVAYLRRSVLEIPSYQDLNLDTLAAMVDEIRHVVGRGSRRSRAEAA
jgi:perosamine synthetase